MTHTPSPADRFAIIPVTHGPAPPNAIAIGSINAVMERIVDSQARADAIDLLVDAAKALGQIERQQEQEQVLIARAIQTLNDSMTSLSRRMDTFEQRRADQARRDEEEEQQRIQDELSRLPDPDAPDPLLLPPHPSGDLHALPAKGTEDQGELPDPLLETEKPPEPKGSVYPQPVSIQLNQKE